MVLDEHSLQSPFVYDLYCHSLRRSTRRKRCNPDVELLRKQLILESSTIQVSTMGAGSSMPATQARRVSQIAASGISSTDQSEILVNLIEQFDCQSILELGTSLGLNAINLSRAIGVDRVVTIEGNRELANKATAHFDQLDINNISLKVNDIDDYFDSNQDTFDMIYIDANHTYEATIRYFDKGLKILNNNGIIIIDDINWSREMARAWTHLTSKNTFLTIENDKLGIIFASKSLKKNNYILRF